MKNTVKLFLVLFLFSSQTIKSQSEEYNNFIREADSLYKAKDYLNSGKKYSEAFKSWGWKGMVNDRYNAACTWALAKEKDSAFFQLFRIATKADYKDLDHLTTDEDLKSLHKETKWNELISLVKQNKEKDEKYLIKPLADMLSKVYKEDQEERQKVRAVQEKYGFDAKETKELWAKINISDSINLLKVKSVLDVYGWLGSDKIGKTGSSALFLVIQHSELETQVKYLPMMREAVKNNRASASSLALLEDRVALRQGKRQIYGSQISHNPQTNKYIIQPLEDPDNVDKRRAEVGLSSLAEYVNNWNIKWDVEQYKKDLPALDEEYKIIK